MNDVFITAIGAFLPNQPVSNDEMEEYLGKINGTKSQARTRVLKQNGIKSRYYALNKNQESTHSNAQLAAKAVAAALKKSTLLPQKVELLATGTTQGDLPVPGFASMVHAETDIPTCEIANYQSVCASSMMALKGAFSQIKAGEKQNAICVGSEFASRLFKASRFEKQQIKTLPFDTEFLRWMLSDGAGAMVLQNEKNRKGLSLKIEWIDIKSHAHDSPLCMFAGKVNGKDREEATWLDFPDFESASQAGAINLKQNTRLLNRVIEAGVAHYFELIDRQCIMVDEIDWLCCHYSSEFFKQPIKDLMQKGGALIPDEKWFSNLPNKGNTGAASIYIMLEELMNSEKLKEGNTILCMVPESGRFITSFMKLRVIGQQRLPGLKSEFRKIEPPELKLNKNPGNEWLIRQLAQIWIDFEAALLQVPIVQKIHEGTLDLEDYKLLLKDLRQQVIDGSQWISRAASNIHIDLFELRSAFIQHTATEHKDFKLLERNYLNVGGTIETIRSGEKNVGSEALSAFMFQRASNPNPLDLLGAMFIIEGIGKRLAGHWGKIIQDQLALNYDQVSFFTYHGTADEHHFHRLEEALNHPGLTDKLGAKIAKTAKITANLYQLQLKELGNY